MAVYLGDDLCRLRHRRCSIPTCFATFCINIYHFGESALSYQKENECDVFYEHADSNIYPNIC